MCTHAAAHTVTWGVHMDTRRSAVTLGGTWSGHRVQTFIPGPQGVSVHTGLLPGLKTAPETKKSAHRRGICEAESSHGVIMEKFIKDVARSSRSGRARESSERPHRLSRRAGGDWKEASFSRREAGASERGPEGGAFGEEASAVAQTWFPKSVLWREKGATTSTRKGRAQCTIPGAGQGNGPSSAEARPAGPPRRRVPAA